jgi:acetoin utilization protein AcuB
MADTKIGGMPVMRSGKLVGMITETDLFKIFFELMGARTKALRVTALVEDKPGQLAKVTKAIADAGGNFLSFGMFSGPDTSSRILTFKVAGMKKEEVTKALTNVVKKFWDIRLS